MTSIYFEYKGNERDMVVLDVPSRNRYRWKSCVSPWCLATPCLRARRRARNSRSSRWRRPEGCRHPPAGSSRGGSTARGSAVGDSAGVWRARTSWRRSPADSGGAEGRAPWSWRWRRWASWPLTRAPWPARHCSPSAFCNLPHHHVTTSKARLSLNKYYFKYYAFIAIVNWHETEL